MKGTATIIFMLICIWTSQAKTAISDSARLQKIVNKSSNGKLIKGTVINVATETNSWIGSSGNLQNNSPYFIASTTKLFVTAIIMKLRAEKQLDLDDKISKYLPEHILNGLHQYKGKDHSGEITIRHLLSQTSGLPDYFEQKPKGGTSLRKDLMSGKDRGWTFEEAIAISKKIQPKFKPGAKKKAHYSDTNYQLLAGIIERITGKRLPVVITEMITEPLQMTNTYLYNNINDTTPKTLYYKRDALRIPKAMTSFGGDGGGVSTAADNLVFIKAFMTGKLFPVAYLTEMQHWNPIFAPLEYGVGIMRFRIPAIFNVLSHTPAVIGHSGLSGAFAFYCPEKNIYITGTVNQINKPSSSYKLLVKVLQSVN